jgi:hypothetical protein
MKNIILVEGKDDKALIEYLSTDCQVNNISGLNKLVIELTKIKGSFLKTPYQKIGIILDQDTVTKAERLTFVNECLQQVFGIQLLDTETFVDLMVEEIPLQIACHFVNVDGKGEIETILRLIKNHQSNNADCLEKWQNCLTEKLSQKEFDKLWVYNYLKYDTATHQERQQAGTYCTLEYSLKHKIHIWNLASPVLDELKGFLASFD